MFAGLLLLPALSATRDARAQKGPPWGQHAEENFYLGPGMGPRLMTEQEWQEHRKKMQSMSPEERQKYREEWHKKMVERARERGITMPETPGPKGPGKGPGGGESQMAVLPATEDDGIALQVRREDREHVGEAIASLPVTFRLPLVLKEIIGFSMAEVAGILGIKEATAKTRVHRARLRLRQAVEAGLASKEGPPPLYSKQVCLDLLQAKQEALDRGVAFPRAKEIICERCQTVFATMDLAHEVCQELSDGQLPEGLRKLVLAPMNR